jgi:hypothetical protein
VQHIARGKLPPRERCRCCGRVRRFLELSPLAVMGYMLPRPCAGVITGIGSASATVQ